MNIETLSKTEMVKLTVATTNRIIINAYLILSIPLYSTGHWIGGTAALIMIVVHALDKVVQALDK